MLLPGPALQDALRHGALRTRALVVRQLHEHVSSPSLVDQRVDQQVVLRGQERSSALKEAADRLCRFPAAERRVGGPKVSGGQIEILARIVDGGVRTRTGTSSLASDGDR